MEQLNKLLQAQFNKMCDTGKLFRSSITGNQMWDLYIGAFAPVYNPVFRDPNSSVHNCNLCKNFIRRYGNVVSIDENYNIITMFDVKAPEEFVASLKSMSDALNRAKIDNVFFETFDELKSLPYEACTKNNSHFKLGIDKNVKRYTKEEAEKYGVVQPNEIRTFHHFCLYLPKQFVDMGSKSIESIMADYRDAKNVFQRAMQEISLDTLHLVRDLISQDSLLDGKTHLYKIEQFIPLKQQYDNTSRDKQDNWCWVNSYKLPFAKFKNELIGTICSELAEGKELNDACTAWNKRVDPANYMKATAPITRKQIGEAQKFVEENGYVESFNRRFATIDDIKASEILHVNVGKGEIQSVSIFDGVKSVSTRHKRSEFEGIEEVSIDTFMKDILPTCTSVEAYLLNKHEKHLVSLTTANIPDSKSIFKWSNNYSWTFNGNLAGKSQIKEAVKTAGGNVTGVLRFSIMWSGDKLDNSDLDAHCIEPKVGGIEIYYGSRISARTRGNLDVDITQPLMQMPTGAVENITYPAINNMIDGAYKFYVHQYADRGSRGFKAEIEFNGEPYSYEYPKRVIGNIPVANVTLRNGEFSIEHHLPESSSSKELYGLPTNEFHKVNLICLSPNHWGDNNVGNKHYFFMLEGCKSPDSIRGFHNENLNSDLVEHRKVMEVLGATNQISPADKQLSGLGFNTTVRDELIVKLQGSFKRMLKIKF